MSEFSANPSPNNPLQSCYGSLDDALISLCDHVEALATSSIAGLTICDPSRNPYPTRHLSTIATVRRVDCGNSIIAV
jgi:hypothetical protein